MKNWLIRFCYKIISIAIYKQKQIEILYLSLQPNTAIDKTFYIGAGSFFNIETDIKELRIFENVVARKSCNFTLRPGATLIIHNNVFFNNYCSINCLGRIEIGANTMFGEGVKLYDHNHLYHWDENSKLNIQRDNFKTGAITIGENCWIASNVTILNNVKIGDNVIVGAGCVVYKDVPANTILRLNSNEAIINNHQ